MTECRHYLSSPVASRRGRRTLPLVVDASDSCALDVADRGGEPLAQVARRLGMSRESARQILGTATRKLRPYLDRIGARG